MKFEEPGSTEVFFTVAVCYSIGSPFYKNYTKSLNLKGNEKILDYGSGSGALSRHVAQILLKGEGHLTCVDISRKWMNIIKKMMNKYPNVNFKFGKIDNVDIPDESYDAIVIHYVLHDIESDLRGDILKVLIQKLKDGGKIYIREPIADNHGMPTSEIKKLMQKAGLKEINLKINKIRFMGQITEAIFQK
jgi:ubiquinone/menaquinone biosynthesis C-methylase UbiE